MASIVHLGQQSAPTRVLNLHSQKRSRLDAESEATESPAVGFTHVETDVVRYYRREQCPFIDEQGQPLSDTSGSDLIGFEFNVTPTKTKIYFRPGTRWFYYWFTLTKEPYHEIDVRHACTDWESLLFYCEKILHNASNKLLREDGDIPRDLLRSLTKVADLITHIETVYADLYRAAHAHSDPTLKVQLAAVRETEARLSKKIDSLIQRASNIMSIDEAYKSREQGASLRRLSWITFIFLPLLFVSALFGMNVDVLATNPPWWTYFYVVTPVCLAIGFVFLFLKYRKSFKWRQSGISVFADLETQVPMTRDFEADVFMTAAANGHALIVEEHLRKGLYLKPGIATKATQLAVENGHCATVRLLLDHGVSVDVPGQYHRSLLHAAAQKGHEDVVSLLLARGANPEATSRTLGSPLYVAASVGYEGIVRLLLDSGAKSNTRGGDYGYPLQVAALKGYLGVVQRLLDYHADVNLEGGTHWTSLQAAALEGHQAILEILLNRRAKVNAQGGKYGTPLQAAVVGGHKAVVEILLRHRADVNARAGKYWTAIQAAAASGETLIFQLLLNNRADVKILGGQYGSPLQAAAEKGHDAIVKLLVDRTWNPNSQQRFHPSLLHVSAERGHAAVVRLLLDYGADVNSNGDKYRSPLEAAAVGNKPEIVSILLDYGAQVNTTGGKYGSALQAAAALNHGNVVLLLLDRGANINCQEGEYGSALQLAAAEGYDPIVKLLLARGALFNVPRERRITAV